MQQKSKSNNKIHVIANNIYNLKRKDVNESMGWISIRPGSQTCRPGLGSES